MTIETKYFILLNIWLMIKIRIYRRISFKREQNVFLGLG